jgi:hypothetical protein
MYLDNMYDIKGIVKREEEPVACAARSATLLVECSIRWLFMNVSTQFIILLKLPGI